MRKCKHPQIYQLGKMKVGLGQLAVRLCQNQNSMPCHRSCDTFVSPRTYDKPQASPRPGPALSSPGLAPIELYLLHPAVSLTSSS